MRRVLTLLVVLTLCTDLGNPHTVAAAPVTYHAPRDGGAAPPGTSIAVRAAEALDPRSVQPERFVVLGEQSGRHLGRATVATDGRTALFYPAQPFSVGERVHVSVGPGLRTAAGASVSPASFTFSVVAVSPADTLRSVAASRPPVAPGAVMAAASSATRSFVTVPGAFASTIVTTSADQAAPGYLFVAPFAFDPNLIGSYPTSIMILDNSGEPVFVKQIPNNMFAGDFKPLGGDKLSYFDGNRQGYVILDQAYREVRLVQAGNGYAAETDNHELLLLPNGNVLLMVYAVVPRDLSAIGGRADAKVIDLLVQEIDPQGNVVFEWNSADHEQITDTYEPIVNSTLLDYSHGNAIEVDADGNLLVSQRHLASIIKIDRETGEVLWRLGGKRSDFRFVDDSGFYYQHDIRRLPNGNITLFDNRTNKSPVYSRGVEYELDEVNKVARRIWEFYPRIGYYSLAMGNMQTLPNGNRLIGWGTGLPTLTEVTLARRVVHALTFATPYINYRAYRFPWAGTPEGAPALVARVEDGLPALYMSWNGSTETATWQIEGGPQPDVLAAIGTRPRSGFETRVVLPDLPPTTCYIRVTALDATGTALRSSPPVALEAGACAARGSNQVWLPLIKSEALSR